MSFNVLSDNATKLWDHYIVHPVSHNDLHLNALLFGGIACLAFIATTLYTHRTDKLVPYKHGIPFVGSWSFFTNRYRFIEDGMAKLGGRFKFKILEVGTHATSSFLSTPAEYHFSTRFLLSRVKAHARYSSATRTSA
jgi:hypothetical protein